MNKINKLLEKFSDHATLFTKTETKTKSPISRWAFPIAIIAMSLFSYFVVNGSGFMIVTGVALSLSILMGNNERNSILKENFELVEDENTKYFGVLLRPFSKDTTNYWYGESEIEKEFTSLLIKFNIPLITIDNKETTAVSSGSVRVIVKDKYWKDFVTNLINISNVIILDLTIFSENMMFELKEVKKRMLSETNNKKISLIQLPGDKKLKVTILNLIESKSIKYVNSVPENLDLLKKICIVNNKIEYLNDDYSESQFLDIVELSK